MTVKNYTNSLTQHLPMRTFDLLVWFNLLSYMLLDNNMDNENISNEEIMIILKRYIKQIQR